jgi:hypothetical protein
MASLPDLFEPVVPKAEWHPYFARILKHGSDAERRVLREWADGFVDRDGKFVREFQTTFNSCFWELYLHASLRQLGMQPDLSHPSPDFLADGRFGALALEAVVALNPKDLSPDWAKHSIAEERGVGADRERLLDLAALRLAQSIQAKADKWMKSYSTLAHCVDRSFIICVAPFDQPQTQRQETQAIARVLFGEPRHLLLNDEARTVAVGGVTLQETFKPSGARVQLGLFRDARLAHVSGLLFSSLATWSKVNALAEDDGRPLVFQAVRRQKDGSLTPVVALKPDYVETLLDGLHLFANPFADRPLETKRWADAGVGVHRLVGPDLVPESDEPDGVLVTRVCIGFKSDADPVHPPGAPEAIDFPSHAISKPKDGEWFGGPAVLGTSDDVFLMLHRGWTICVGHDPTDDDWQYIVKRGSYLSIQQFIDAGDGGPKHTAIDVSIPSRLEAVERARGWIATSGLPIWRSPSKKRRRPRT